MPCVSFATVSLVLFLGVLLLYRASLRGFAAWTNRPLRPSPWRVARLPTVPTRANASARLSETSFPNATISASIRRALAASLCPRRLWTRLRRSEQPIDRWLTWSRAATTRTCSNSTTRSRIPPKLSSLARAQSCGWRRQSQAGGGKEGAAWAETLPRRRRGRRTSGGQRRRRHRLDGTRSGLPTCSSSSRAVEKLKLQRQRSARHSGLGLSCSLTVVRRAR
mmetsp:Transcript_12748/g.40293  ORF Transcript_12748/g.40293 Transcript_12748/m.40293 type:complete len:222 (-) Transcript_12748:478-1143(-)